MTASQVGDESVDGWAMLMLLADKCVVYFDQLLGAACTTQVLQTFRMKLLYLDCWISSCSQYLDNSYRIPSSVY